MTDRLGNLPRYAILRGKRVRIIDYEDGRFTVLDHLDTRRIVTRDRLTFVKSTKKN